MCGSEKNQEIEFLNLIVSCPRLGSGVPLHISVSDCKACPEHKGLEVTTELRGIKVFDVLCNLPVRRRAIHVVREVKDGPTE